MHVCKCCLKASVLYWLYSTVQFSTIKSLKGVLLTCWVHLCFSKETLLLEPEKTAPRIETLEPEKVDEEEGEGKKDESSCSSEEEEEEDSESENEAGTWNIDHHLIIQSICTNLQYINFHSSLVFFSDKSKSSVPSSVSNSTPTTAPSSITVTSPTTPSNQVTTPTSPTKKVLCLC